MDNVWNLTQSDIDDIIPMIDDPFKSDPFLVQESNAACYPHVDCSASPLDFLQTFSDSSDSSPEYQWSDSSSQTSPDSSPFAPGDDCFSPVYASLQTEQKYSPSFDAKPKSAINKKSTRTAAAKVTKKPTYDANSSLTFSRAELLKMTVNELEDRVRVIESVRSLTSFEKKEVKRQRRMIKNRESAYASRVRKRQLVESMEEQVNQVQKENESLKARVAHLEQENQQLKSKLAGSSFWSVGPSKSLNPNNITSTSLFIVLLSFGLLFAQLQPNSGTTFPSFAAFPTLGDSSPNPGHVIPINSNIYKPTSSSLLMGAGRGLLMIDDPHTNLPSCITESLQLPVEIFNSTLEEGSTPNDIHNTFTGAESIVVGSSN